MATTQRVQCGRAGLATLWYDLHMKKNPVGKLRVTKSKKVGGYIIGQRRFEKISAVEGIVITRDMKGRFADFDRRGLAAEARRESIKRAYRKG